MYLIPVTCTIIYTFTELNELDSVHRSNKTNMKQATHLIQKIIIEESNANENLVYILNLILGNLFISGFSIPTIIFFHTPINIISFIIIGMFISLIIMNTIVSLIDRKYDNYWITTHRYQIRQSGKEK